MWHKSLKILNLRNGDGIFVCIRFKTKLEASLAQYRIKQNLLTIDSYLPPAVRAKQQRSQTVPLYAWVNTLKAR